MSELIEKFRKLSVNYIESKASMLCSFHNKFSIVWHDSVHELSWNHLNNKYTNLITIQMKFLLFFCWTCAFEFYWINCYIEQIRTHTHTHTRHTRARGIQIVYVFDLSRIEAISYGTIQCNSRPNRHLATLLLLFYLDSFYFVACFVYGRCCLALLILKSVWILLLLLLLPFVCRWILRYIYAHLWAYEITYTLHPCLVIINSFEFHEWILKFKEKKWIHTLLTSEFEQQ